MTREPRSAARAPAPPPSGAAASKVFEQHRGLLFSIAYRMLGSVADAEDVVQEAFLRWRRATADDVRSPRACLVTVVSRLAINHLQSARVRREQYVGEWLPEPVVTGPGSDPARTVQVDESVSMAMLLLLERLTPAERAVFLLHEVFDYKHAEIAAALELTEENSRQLLRRAQRDLRRSRPRFRPPARQHRDLLERFRDAADSGNVDRLISMLSTDVVLHTDGGGRAEALRLPIHGPEHVARAAVHGLERLRSLDVSQSILEVNGQPAIVSYREGRPQSVFSVEVSGGRIHAIYVVTNPEKLSRLPAPPA